MKSSDVCQSPWWIPTILTGVITTEFVPHERPAIKPHARAISCPLGADVMDGERRVSVRTLESGMDSTSANDSVQSEFSVNSTERCNLVTGTVTWFSRIRLLR